MSGTQEVLNNEDVLEGSLPPLTVSTCSKVCAGCRGNPALWFHLSLFSFLVPSVQSSPSRLSPEHHRRELAPESFHGLTVPRRAPAPLSPSIPARGALASSERLDLTCLFHFTHIEFEPLEPHIQRNMQMNANESLIYAKYHANTCPWICQRKRPGHLI